MKSLAHQLAAPQQSDILIVDDTIENLVFLASVLESEGYLVRKARNGAMALRAVQDALPDLILLDIRMPGMDGYEVCRRLKGDPVTAEIPVMFLSALDDVGDKVKAFEVGAADYMTKPFQIDEVLVRTRNQLLLQSALQTVKQLNVCLEDKVRQRTRQLEFANHQLMEMAYHDALTGLPNRSLLSECLTRAIESMQHDPDYQFALMFLDCDRFKLINDSFGHAVGDALLVEVTQRLLPCIQPDDTLARFGGDEFVVLINQIDGPEQAAAIAQSLLTALEPSFQLTTQEVFINASIGVVLSDRDLHDTPEKVLRDADTAMYSAKNRGRAQINFFAPAMQQASAHQLQIETGIRQAIQREEFVPYYQPIVDLHRQNVTGVEVLCRWQHPEQGLLTPNFFIPIAEETHLIVDLSKSLLDKACAQLRQWQRQQLVDDQFYISFNLAARHLGMRNLPHQIADCLTRHQLQPHHLHLEITESDVLDNAIAINVMKALRQQGLKLSVDDFGTGYSSLSYLYTLPVNTIKIDRVFIKDIDQNPKNSSIVEAIVGIAKALNLDVIIEGIDSVQQTRHLRKLNCRFGQGYLFSQPLPAIDIQTLLAENYSASQYIQTHRSQNSTLPARFTESS